MFAIQMYDSYDQVRQRSVTWRTQYTVSCNLSLLLHVHILTVLIILVIPAGVICYHHHTSVLWNDIHFQQTVWAISKISSWHCSSWEKVLPLGWSCSRLLWELQKKANINCRDIWPLPGDMGESPHNRSATPWTVCRSVHLTVQFIVLVWWVWWQLVLQFPS